METRSMARIRELTRRYPALEACEGAVVDAAEALISCFRGGGRLLACGNGGSAADCVHVVGELMKGFVLPRRLKTDMREKLCESCPETAQYLIDHLQGALPAISLVTELGLSTAYANDKAPDLAFAQQVFGQGRKGDALLAITTSGNSANVVYAAQVARAMGITVIALTGEGGGKMRCWSDILIAVPEKETFKVQELHLPVYHALCLAVEEEFFGE